MKHCELLWAADIVTEVLPAYFPRRRIEIHYELVAKLQLRMS